MGRGKQAWIELKGARKGLLAGVRGDYKCFPVNRAGVGWANIEESGGLIKGD